MVPAPRSVTARSRQARERLAQSDAPSLRGLVMRGVSRTRVTLGTETDGLFAAARANNRQRDE